MLLYSRHRFFSPSRGKLGAHASFASLCFEKERLSRTEPPPPYFHHSPDHVFAAFSSAGFSKGLDRGSRFGNRKSGWKRQSGV